MSPSCFASVRIASSTMPLWEMASFAASASKSRFASGEYRILLSCLGGRDVFIQILYIILCYTSSVQPGVTPGRINSNAPTGQSGHWLPAVWMHGERYSL